MSPISIDDIIKPYEKIISAYNANQLVEWTRWKSILPQRVAYVTNEHAISGKKVSDWKNASYICIILSTIIPIIIAIIIEVLSLSHLASLFDAVLPAITIVVQKILSGWSQKRHVLASVYSPYQRLLSSILYDIYKNSYAVNHQQYSDTWEDLDQTLQILDENL